MGSGPRSGPRDRHLKAGIGIRGIRYYGEGLAAETGIEETAWQESDDEEMLRGGPNHVAANIAEMMRGFEPKGGYPSRFFDDATRRNPPSTQRM